MANTWIDVSASGGEGGGGVTLPINLATQVDGVLPVANGGTNSSTALSNGRLIQSLSGKLVEMSSVFVVQPDASDAGPALQTAIDAANTAGGGRVQLLVGTYAINTGINCVGYNNVEIVGMGDSTLMLVGNVTNNSGVGIRFRASQLTSNVEAQAISDVALGATSITLSTVGRAGDWKAGDLVTIRGTDINSLPEVEVNRVAADGNASSGVVTLSWPVPRAIASATASASTGNKNNKIKSMKFSILNALQDMCSVQIGSGENNLIEDCMFTNSDDSSAGDIQLIGYNTTNGFRNIIRSCRFIDTLSAPVLVKAQNNAVVENSQFKRCCTNGGGISFVMVRDFTRDVVIRGNDFFRSGAYAIQFAVDTARRITIENNQFSHMENYAINGTQNEIYITNNVFENIATYAILCQSGKRMVVSNNRIAKTAGGIILQQTGACHNQIIGNHIIYCPSDGIASYGDYCDISNNTIFNFASYGLYIKGTGNKIMNNTLDTFSGGTYGIDLDNAQYCMAMGNVVQNGGTKGFDVENSSDNNTVAYNMLNGVTLTQGTASNNLFIGNK